jgi:hypothetical protein
MTRHARKLRHPQVRQRLTAELLTKLPEELTRIRARLPRVMTAGPGVRQRPKAIEPISRAVPAHLRPSPATCLRPRPLRIDSADPDARGGCRGAQRAPRLPRIRVQRDHPVGLLNRFPGHGQHSPKGVPRGQLRSLHATRPARGPARRNARGSHDRHRGSRRRRATAQHQVADRTSVRPHGFVVCVCDGASWCGRSGQSGADPGTLCGCLLMWSCPRPRPCLAPPTDSGTSPQDWEAATPSAV